MFLRVVDSKSGSIGEQLLVRYALMLRSRNREMDEIVHRLEVRRNQIRVLALLDTLEYAKKGGRLGTAAAAFGTLLSIKPVLYVPDDGTLIASSKVRGRKAALNTIVDAVLKELDVSQQEDILINHADCLEDADYVRQRIREAFPNAHIQISGLGVVIGAHCGPGLLTVFYMTDKRRP